MAGLSDSLSIKVPPARASDRSRCRAREAWHSQTLRTEHSPEQFSANRRFSGDMTLSSRTRICSRAPKALRWLPSRLSPLAMRSTRGSTALPSPTLPRIRIAYHTLYLVFEIYAACRGTEDRTAHLHRSCAAT